jgi:hypothetical protein
MRDRGGSTQNGWQIKYRADLASLLKRKVKSSAGGHFTHIKTNFDKELNGLDFIKDLLS